MKTLARMCALMCAVSLGVSLAAQVAANAPTNTDQSAALQLMTDALKLRTDLAATVVAGAEPVETSIGRLRSGFSPSGLKIDPDADFAFAAIDVGHRLIAARKPAEAEQFFAEAETAMVSMIQKTPDSAAAEKAMYLQELARIRIRFLNKVVDGKADLAAALKLQPNDKNLQRFRNDLLKDKAEILQGTVTKG